MIALITILQKIGIYKFNYHNILIIDGKIN